jgi:membrane protease YdiL (CAAX protease family)
MLSRTKFPWFYLVLAYGLAWMFWIPVALTRQDYQSSPLLLLFVLLGVFGPGLAGIILTYIEADREKRRDYCQRILDLRRIRSRWVAVIILLWPALHILTLILNNIFNAPLPDFTFFKGLLAQPLSIPVIVVLYFVQAGLEELGWRGYMLERVLPSWGFVKSSLVVGVFHALWHLPLFWVVGTNQIKIGLGFNFMLFLTQAVAFSVFVSWCYIGNSHSTLAVMLFHFTGNLCNDLFTFVPGTLKYQLQTLLMVLGAVVICVGWIRRTRERSSHDVGGAELHTMRAGLPGFNQGIAQGSSANTPTDDWLSFEGQNEIHSDNPHND